MEQPNKTPERICACGEPATMMDFDADNLYYCVECSHFIAERECPDCDGMRRLAPGDECCHCDTTGKVPDTTEESE